MFYLDAAIYGHPDYGMNSQPSRTFTGGIGDVGKGQYGPYNPTGPQSASLTYHWQGPTMALFRAAWEDQAQLNFGGGWFYIELPLMINGTTGAFNVYQAHFLSPFAATMEGYDYWAVSMELDVDTSPALVFA